MLKNIRRVSFPEVITTSSAWIKSVLINHVSDYHDLIGEARRQSDLIIEAAQQQADGIRSLARQEAIQSVKKDYQSMLKLFNENDRLVQAKLNASCIEISLAAVERFFHTQSAAEKIRGLIAELLRQAKGVRKLHFHCHPSVSQIVADEVASILSAQMNFKAYEVHSELEMSTDEVKIMTSNGAEIHVSLKNITGLLEVEMKAFLEAQPILVESSPPEAPHEN